MLTVLRFLLCCFASFLTREILIIIIDKQNIFSNICVVCKNKCRFAQILIKITNKTMKKLFTLVAVASMFTFVACGPSAEEKAAAEKKIADSTAAYNDQLAAAEAAKAQATADSIAAAATKKGGKKK